MNIPLKNDTIRDLVYDALDQADTAARAILELELFPLEPGETRLDRAWLISRHAIALAEAWAVIDTIMRSGPPSPKVSPPVVQGCSTGATN